MKVGEIFLISVVTGLAVALILSAKPIKTEEEHRPSIIIEEVV